MDILRDPLFTYEVCQPGDLRRPRPTFERLDQRWVVDLARSLCHDDANLRVVTRLVRDAGGCAVEGPLLYERFAELVACGRLVLRELSAPECYPLPDPYAEPAVALVELEDEEPLDQEGPPKTWISLELVHTAGVSADGLELEVTTASGRELHGRLADGRWRCNDIDAGTCSIHLLDHPVLHRRRRPRTHLRSSQPPRRGDAVWRVGSEPRLELRAAEHHRIVIVQPPEPYCPSA
jgi:hypothetical protein